MGNSPKIRHFIELVYIAPQNAVDEKGKPVLVYKRGIELDDKSHKSVVEQMRKGDTDIHFPTQTQLVSGQLINEAGLINLNNSNLMRAQTHSTQQLTEEEVKDSGKTLLYDPDGNIIKTMN